MKLHESVIGDFDDLADGINGMAEQQVRWSLAVVETCQSVIEQRFLINLMMLMEARPIFVRDDLVHIIVEDEFDGFLAIYPQAPIPLGGHNYRADFLITYKTRHPFQVQFNVVVEIDGHDYHERTKQQAMRDKQRDRLMAMEGYTVFRYTGSEIYREPESAVFEVQDYLRKRQQGIFEERGLTH